MIYVYEIEYRRWLWNGWPFVETGVRKCKKKKGKEWIAGTLAMDSRGNERYFDHSAFIVKKGKK